MNDDDLLFPLDDIEKWKRREMPPLWLEEQMNALLARCAAQAADGERPCINPIEAMQAGRPGRCA